MSLVRAAYSVAMWCAQPLLRRKLRRRAQYEPLYGHAVEERLGHYADIPPGAMAGCIWVHAVSLGETRAAGILLAQLRTLMPGMRVLLTHSTATGRSQGQALLHEGDRQVWQPWDSPAVVERFLTHFRPRIGVLLETEVWPNWVAACQRHGVPLCLVNARLSEKSLRQAQRLAWLARPAYAGLTAVWAQTDADAQRLRALGAPVQGVLGNVKFDATPDAAQLSRGQQWRQSLSRPVVLLASSREGEEALLLQQIAHLGEAAQAVQWLIVPRHPQRFDAVAELVRAAGLPVSRRSAWGDTPAAEPQQAVWLGDSLGEMALYFGLADVALLGGSFERLGGQNLIEAASCGCPVLMGPHVFNFSEASQLAKAAGAAWSCPDMGHAVQQALALVHNRSAWQQARDAAWRLSENNRGAAQRTAQAVADLAHTTPA